MIRLLIDQGLEMFVRLTVRERDHPDKLGRLLAGTLRIHSSYAALSVTSLVHLPMFMATRMITRDEI
jgi:hypothetical protein